MARTTRSTTALTVKDNAQHIWLAGLGALATASEEGGKVFEDLVEKGANPNIGDSAGCGVDESGRTSSGVPGVGR